MNFKLNYYDQNNEYLITQILILCDNSFRYLNLFVPYPSYICLDLIYTKVYHYLFNFSIDIWLSQL